MNNYGKDTTIKILCQVLVENILLKINRIKVADFGKKVVCF